MEEFVSKRLQELCSDAGISLYQLAKMAGISTSSLYCILKGTASPRLSTLVEVCKSLQITLEQFFIDDNAERHCRDRESKLEELFSELSASNQKFLMEFLNLLIDYQNQQNKTL